MSDSVPTPLLRPDRSRPRRRVAGATATAALAVLGLGVGGVIAPAASAQPGSARVTTTADGTGPGTLRSAIIAANAAGGGTITLARGAYRLALPGADDAAAVGDLDVSSPITIRGRGATVDAAGIDRVFHVLAGGSLRLEQTTVTGGVADDGGAVGNSGGGILNAGDLEVTRRSVVTGNGAVRAGGGIEATAGSATTVFASTLSDNTTGAEPGNGGALHLTGQGTVTVDASTVSGNTAAAEGGGLWNSAAGTMRVTRSTVTGNTASGDEATNGGGGIFNDGGALVVDATRVTGNAADGASGSGGGVMAVGGGAAQTTIGRSRIEDNTSSRAGGGIEVAEGTTTRVDATILRDNATGANPGNGGGLHITGDADVAVNRSQVRGNTAANDGGGLWNSPSGTLTVTRSAVRGNAADGEGDNVYQEGPVAGGVFTLNGRVVPPGDNDL